MLRRVSLLMVLSGGCTVDYQIVDLPDGEPDASGLALDAGSNIPVAMDAAAVRLDGMAADAQPVPFDAAVTDH